MRMSSSQPTFSDLEPRVKTLAKAFCKELPPRSQVLMPKLKAKVAEQVWELLVDYKIGTFWPWHVLNTVGFLAAFFLAAYFNSRDSALAYGITNSILFPWFASVVTMFIIIRNRRARRAQLAQALFASFMVIVDDDLDAKEAKYQVAEERKRSVERFEEEQRQIQADARISRLIASIELPGDGSRAKPDSQPLGVSHRGAEQLCAEWMRYLGAADAQTTRASVDGGIDIESSKYVAQVKNYAGTVGVVEVRELVGVAAVEGKTPLFFTSGKYASSAMDFALRAGVGLFVYSAEEGTLKGSNSVARALTKSGL